MEYFFDELNSKRAIALAIRAKQIAKAACAKWAAS